MDHVTRLFRQNRNEIQKVVEVLFECRAAIARTMWEQSVVSPNMAVPSTIRMFVFLFVSAALFCLILHGAHGCGIGSRGFVILCDLLEFRRFCFREIFKIISTLHIPPVFSGCSEKPG